jgi:anti-sigma factor RsiW
VTAADHDRFEELAAGHALHALEPADEAAFREHLADCADCSAAVDRHTETLGHLAYAAEPADLPAGILAGIRSEIGSPTAVDPVAAPVSLDAARARRRPQLQSRTWLATAAAVALFLALGGWNVALRHDRSQTDERARQLVAAVAALEVPAKHHVTLKDAAGHPVAVAVVTADDSVSLVVNGLAANDTGTSTYVLWQQVGKGMRAVGAFDVGGTKVAVVAALGQALDAEAPGFAVTREPGRTAPVAPSSDPLAAGGLSA